MKTSKSIQNRIKLEGWHIATESEIAKMRNLIVKMATQKEKLTVIIFGRRAGKTYFQKLLNDAINKEKVSK